MRLTTSLPWRVGPDYADWSYPVELNLNTSSALYSKFFAFCPISFLEPETGIEPVTFPLPRERSTTEPLRQISRYVPVLDFKLQLTNSKCEIQKIIANIGFGFNERKIAITFCWTFFDIINTMAYENQKILLVDDDPAFIQLYSMVFQGHGINYSIAMNGAQALEKAKEEHPDLILLDIMLPDLDGFEVLSRLRKEPETTQTPVWMITNLSEQMNKEKAASLGAVDYIVKASTTPNQVCEKIGSHFSI